MFRKRRKRIQIRSRHTPLRMTSMMDILTVLLLFLLKSFVVDAELNTPAPGVELPESSSEASPESGVVIAIFDDNIMMDNELVASVSREVADGDFVIDKLADRLDETYDKLLDLAVARGEHPDDFQAKVAIQGDKEIRFEILQRVMYTVNYSGYHAISLAVVGT